MPAYNAAPFIGPAIESVLAQTFRNFELLIVDDGSTDETPTILRHFDRRDGRIRMLRNDGNRGLVYTRNRLFQAASAPFLAVADADDIFAPTRLERQMVWMGHHPEVGVCGTTVEFIGSDQFQAGNQATILDDYNIRFFLRITPCLWNTTTFYRRELLQQAGGYREGFDAGAEDYDLWGRLLPLTRFANLPEPLVKVRVHPGSLTARGSKCLRNVLKVSARLLEDFLRCPVPIELREELHCFLMHTGMNVSACERAFALARALDSQGLRTESSDTIQLLRDKLGQAAWTQARYLVYAAPSLSRSLGIQALRWKPSLLAHVGTYAYAARSLTPRPAIACAKRLLRTFRMTKPAPPSTPQGEGRSG